MKIAACKCVRTIFLQGDSAFIFITTIDVAKLIFFPQLFLKNHYVFVLLVNMSLCKHADGGGGHEKKRERDILGGAQVWIISYFMAEENAHF